jgi:RecA-family ATPase
VNVDQAGNLCATNLAERISKGYRKEGLAQVVFDPWSGFSPGERFVNDAEASLMMAGAGLARELSCNVRFTGHVSKAVAREGIIDAHSGRGGSAMGDNARFVFSYVQHNPKEEKIWKAIPTRAEQAAARGELYRLHMTKQSYAKCLAEPIWIERHGHRFIVHEGAVHTPETVLKADAERLLAFLRQAKTQGEQYSKSTLEDQHRAYDLSRGTARTVLGRLIASGQIVERALPKAEKWGRRTHYLDLVEKHAEVSVPEDIFEED